LSLDLDRARETFESSTDFTIGLEEEFALLDPATLELEHRFEEVHAACLRDELLAESAAGELIASEIEIRSGRAEGFAEALACSAAPHPPLRLVDGMGWRQAEDPPLGQLPRPADHRHAALQPPAARTATSPSATTPGACTSHGRARRRPGDRRLRLDASCCRLLPLANSPFLDRVDTGLHTVRTQIFTRSFPRCGVPSPFGDWDRYADFIGTLQRTGTVVESTQLWWSVRPHHSFGTVEVRICDAQTRGDESFALAGLIAACIAQTALDFDELGYEGRGGPLADREIEENVWRAIRHGAGGQMIDFRRGRSTRGRAESARWTEPARSPGSAAATGANGASVRTRPVEGSDRRASTARRAETPHLCQRQEAGGVGRQG
jgi:carboxylate-amine ligase